MPERSDESRVPSALQVEHLHKVSMQIMDVFEADEELTTSDALGATIAVMCSLVCELADGTTDHAAALRDYEQLAIRTMRNMLAKAERHGPMRLVTA